MLPPTYSQAQSTAAEAPPPAPAPQPSSGQGRVAGQADRHQEPPMPSTSNVRQQQGNTSQHAADFPRRQIPYPLSESGQAKLDVETTGSRQVQPQLVSRMPEPLPRAHPVTANAAPAAATAPDHAHAQPSASCSVQELTLQIKHMKNKMIHYASLLDNPVWKQQQPDGGKAVSMCTKTCHCVCNVGMLILVDARRTANDSRLLTTPCSSRRLLFSSGIVVHSLCTHVCVFFCMVSGAGEHGVH